jgi:hypothetical protein
MNDRVAADEGASQRLHLKKVSSNEISLDIGQIVEFAGGASENTELSSTARQFTRYMASDEAGSPCDKNSQILASR